jgi:phenylacetaldehyde dehydrogenase
MLSSFVRWALAAGKAKAVVAAADVPLAADLFWYMAGWATKLCGSTVTPSLPYIRGAEFHAYTVKEPVGVVGQIIPWNFPLLTHGRSGRRSRPAARSS